MTKRDKGVRTPEQRAKIGAAAKARWADPEFKARQAQKQRERWKDPEYIERVAQGRKAAANSRAVDTLASEG